MQRLILKLLLTSSIAILFIVSNYTTYKLTQSFVEKKVVDNLTEFCYNRSMAIVEGSSDVYILCTALPLSDEEKKVFKGA